MNEVLNAIKTRHSVRRYTDTPVSRDHIEAILEAGRFAPSGNNTQPWRFVVVESEAKHGELATLFPQQGLVAAAPITLAVLLDREACYNELKDAQGIGAAIENILLAVHALGLGACWMGRTRDKEIERFLGAREHEELMALIPIGHPAEHANETDRLSLERIARFV